MTEHRQPNRLILQKSPYLLQHAYNPVDWYPWGEEAFAKAAAEDKLVLLSIGYATCHWCHVMERESFEDEETAALLNDLFISVKVDREERPDIDSIYMDALQAMGQQGGWPLNIFITPDKDPLFGGTYFPPTPKYGMASFKDVLQGVSMAWRDQRTQLVEAAADLRRQLAAAYAPRTDGGMPVTDCFDDAFHIYSAIYDNIDYGFKTDARNKFPPSMALSFLMSYSRRTGNQAALEIAERTLCAMKRGGIYDQLGGGLCRYSTDTSWLVPHFEKMLYDNALFLLSLAECYQHSGKDFFRLAAYDVIRYVQRDLALAGGGIACAEDADSEGEEGKFYLWSLEEFREVTGDDADLLQAYWRLTTKGNLDGKNILYEDIHQLPLTPEEEFGVERAAIIDANRAKLLVRRSSRPRPLRDDKVLTCWNCLYIRGLVKAGLVFGDANLIASAEEIFAFLADHLFDAGGRLLRRYREGVAGIRGYLNDYAEMGLAACALFKASSDISYIEHAQRLTDSAIELFLSDFGPFYETGLDGEALMRRSVNGYDGVEPSGNSSMATLLGTLSALGIRSEEYTGIADGIFRYFKNEIETHPVTCPAMLQAYALHTFAPTHIVLLGSRCNPEMQRCLAYLNKSEFADAMVISVEPARLEEMTSVIPVLVGKTPKADFTAYVCMGAACRPAVVTSAELERLLMYEQPMV